MKRNKLLRTIIALVVAILMTVSTAPAMAFAADDAATVESTSSGNFFTDIFNLIKDFLNSIGEFLQNLFGTGNDSSTPVIPEAPTAPDTVAPDENWYKPAAPINVYAISTAEELAALAQTVNSGTDSFKGKTIYLAADINLDDRSWTPIGTWYNAFEGTFDGQGYTISYLNINAPTLDSVGLFGVAQNAVFRNINIDNVSIVGYEMVAALVGCPYSGCTISDCNVTGIIDITAEYAYAGGIAAYGYVSVDNCSVIAYKTGKITAKTRNAVGGIMAWMLEGKNKITNCTVKNLDLTGWTNIGALTGFVHYANTIDGCTAENINITKTRDGGHPGVGLAAGGFSYSAKNAITITNNSFRNFTFEGVANPISSADILYGSEYGGNTNSNFITENNTTDNITNNIYYRYEVKNAASLIDVAKTGGDILLTADIDLGTESVNIPSGVTTTINLNGHKISAKYEDTTKGYGTFNISPDAVLNINGSGTISTAASIKSGGISVCMFQNDGTLNIYDGNYEFSQPESVAGLGVVAAIIDNCPYNNAATVNIYGGTFSISGQGAVNMFRNWPISSGAVTRLNIYGGTFNANPDRTLTYIWSKNDSYRTGKNTHSYVQILGGTFNGNMVVEVDGFVSETYIAEGLNIEMIPGSMGGYFAE